VILFWERRESIRKRGVSVFEKKIKKWERGDGHCVARKRKERPSHGCGQREKGPDERKDRKLTGVRELILIFYGRDSVTQCVTFEFS
jgi:hypothetical protein